MDGDAGKEIASATDYSSYQEDSRSENPMVRSSENTACDVWHCQPYKPYRPTEGSDATRQDASTENDQSPAAFDVKACEAGILLSY